MSAHAAYRTRRAALLAVCVVILASCAGRPDHFYTLNTIPDAVRSPATGYGTHVVLRVSIPSLVDRPQMTVDASGDKILILEHERWAAPLSDLVSQTLARDIEQRRTDVLVADRSFDQADVKPVHVDVAIVRMSAHQGTRATLEARWRIADPASQMIGGGTFTAPIEGDDYAAIARAFSTCLASLADRLVEKLPSH